MTKTQSITTPYRGLSVFQDIPPATDLPKLYRNGKVIHIPPNAGWTTALVGGNATFTPAYVRLDSSGAVNSSALSLFNLWGFSDEGSGNFRFFDWSKEFYLQIPFILENTPSQSRRRFQIKEATTLGEPGVPSIGLRCDGYDLKGETYNTALGIVDLSTTVAINTMNQLLIHHAPTIPKVEWYINGTLKGNQTNTALFPTVIGTADCSFVASVNNGPSGGSAHYLTFLQSHLWVAR